MSGGLFVVFEGGDRVGKSTQVRALAASLAASGVAHVVTHEPGGSQVGQAIRQLLLDPVNRLDDRAEALLYLADKAQHVTQVVLPALVAGQVVVCDRYVDSLLAYQGAGRELGVAELAGLAAWATHGLRPDLTVLLDADPQRAVAQARGRDRLEAAGQEFHERVRQGFLELARTSPGNYLILPGLTSVRQIAARVRAAVAERLDRGLVDPELAEPGEHSQDGGR